MDIKFEKDGYKFNVRSSCIIIDKKHEKIILSNMRGIKSRDVYLLPGGRVELLEDSISSIKREIEEELGIKLLECKLVSIEENFNKDIMFHMIEFIYYSEIESFELITCLDDGWDKFKIINIDEIDNYDIRPKGVKQLIKKNIYNEINHNINYDWGEE